MDAIIVGIHNRIIVCIISSVGDYAVRIVILVSLSLWLVLCKEIYSSINLI